jgi:Leucine-rich repeat (LRR) protein
MTAKCAIRKYGTRSLLIVVICATSLLYETELVSNLATNKQASARASANKSKNTTVRHINFGNHSLGTLQIRTGSENAWAKDAIGKISVPQDAYVELRCLYETSGKNMQALEGLGTNDLQGIDLSTSNVRDHDLAVVGKMYGLHAITLSHTGIGDEGLKHLDKLPALKQLYLNDTMVTDRGIGYLKGIEKLEELDLSRTNITGRALAQLASIISLRRLSIGQTKIGDEDLANLAKLPLLEMLDLSRTNISDRGLEQLSGLTHLRELGLNETRISSRGLSCLKKMNALQRLNLSHTVVDDSGLAMLVQLAPKCLNLDDAKISTTGLLRLHSCLKKCNFVDSVQRAFASLGGPEGHKIPKDVATVERALDTEISEHWQTMPIDQQITFAKQLIRIKKSLGKSQEVLNLYEKVLTSEIGGGPAFVKNFAGSLFSLLDYCRKHADLVHEEEQILKRLEYLVPKKEVPPCLLVSLGTVCQETNRDSEAKAYFLRAVAAMDAWPKLKDSGTSWAVLQKLGYMAENAKDTGAAIKYFKRASVECQDLDAPYRISSMLGVGRCYFAQGNFVLCRGILEPAINEAVERNNLTNEVMKTSLVLLRCYMIEHQTAQARKVLHAMERFAPEEPMQRPSTKDEPDALLKKLEYMDSARGIFREYRNEPLAIETTSIMKKLGYKGDFR